MTIADFALFGAVPRFAPALQPHPAQDLERLAPLLQGVFERRYFANHGPLAQRLDAELAGLLGRRHAVCVVNWQLAVMLALKALDANGGVGLPERTRPGTHEALAWCGLNDVGGEAAWADVSDALSSAATHPARVLLLSLQAGEWIDAGEGGCIATDDDELAARLRTLRNFHPSHTERSGLLFRTNAKISEAQAAQALAALQGLDSRRAAQVQVHARLAAALDAPIQQRLQSAGHDIAAGLVLDWSGSQLDAAQAARLLAAEGVPTQRRDGWLTLPCHAGIDTGSVLALAERLNAIWREAAALHIAMEVLA
jgi:dTDP-4-amino-4,6-dideoxygalactose transaminase